jgi:sugar-specific transcriptional regulator TrmB
VLKNTYLKLKKDVEKIGKIVYTKGVFTSVLVENGFSEKEAALYLAILEAGEATLGNIAKRANIKRSTVYSLVDELKKKGVVSAMKKRGINYISALSPRLLIDRFEQSTERAKNILPGLMDLAYASPVKPRIRFYEGIDGLNEMLFEASHSTHDYIGFTDYEKMPAEMYRFIRKEVAPRREKNNVMLRLIVPRNKGNAKVVSEYHHQVEHRMVDFPSRKNHIEILLYEGSKIGFMSYKKGEMFGVVMDSEAIFTTLHDLFMVIWEGAGQDS